MIRRTPHGRSSIRDHPLEPRAHRRRGRVEPFAAGARRALEAYWYPLYAFIRRRGHTPEQAADLTQGYLLQVLEKGYLKQVTPAGGRFRSFLFVSVQHYLSNQRDRERAVKRGGGRMPLSLDAEAAEGRYRIEPSDELTPERLFERRWALEVLDRAMALPAGRGRPDG